MYGNNQQMPGFGGQPSTAPPEGGPHPQPEAGGPYQQPPFYGPPPPAAAPMAPPLPPQYSQQPQQAMAYPTQTYPTQQNFIQPGISTVMTAQPYQQPQPFQPHTVVAQQQRLEKPQNCMVLAILVTIFCNCPLGALAWIFSCLSDTAYNEGDQANARSRGRISMSLSMFGVLITVILCIAIPVAILNVYTRGDYCDGYSGKNWHGTSGCYSCSECCTSNIGFDRCNAYQKLSCMDRCYP